MSLKNFVEIYVVCCFVVSIFLFFVFLYYDHFPIYGVSLYFLALGSIVDSLTKEFWSEKWGSTYGYYHDCLKEAKP